MRTAAAVHRFLMITMLVVALVSASCAPSGRPGTLRRPGGPPAPAATPQATSSVIIEVAGTQGLRFGGSYGQPSELKTIEATVPARLTFNTLAQFSVALQKRGKEGELRIVITVDGREVNRAATVKPFGVVTYIHRVGR